MREEAGEPGDWRIARSLNSFWVRLADCRHLVGGKSSAQSEKPNHFQSDDYPSAPKSRMGQPDAHAGTRVPRGGHAAGVHRGAGGRRGAPPPPVPGTAPPPRATRASSCRASASA